MSVDPSTLNDFFKCDSPNEPEQPLWGMKLQEKEEEKDEKDIGELLWKRAKKKSVY